MVRTQIQLTEEQARGIKRIAAARHISAAEVIRQAVDMTLGGMHLPDEGEKKKRAIAAAGKFSSGKRNISKEHDRYLSEDFSK